MPFNYDRDYSKLNLRDHPKLYSVGKDEQGILLVKLYKREILPYWRFKTPDIAKESAEKIRELFETYRKNDDFVDMGMARKFIQMGYTRARRYANHKSGRKYNEDGTVKEQEVDEVKVESAAIFKEYWDADYLELKRTHQKKYG